MKDKGHREETSADVATWMESLKEESTSSQRPPGYHKDAWAPFSLELTSSRHRDFSVVPMIDFWVPSEDQALSVLQTKGIERLYATGLHVQQKVYRSSPMEVASLESMMLTYLRSCLIAPRNEDFLLLNTSLDYWLLAGPLPLVEAMIDSSLDEAFEKFSDSVNDFPYFEAGRYFAADVMKKYKLHNEHVRRRKK